MSLEGKINWNDLLTQLKDISPIVLISVGIIVIILIYMWFQKKDGDQVNIKTGNIKTKKGDVIIGKSNEKKSN